MAPKAKGRSAPKAKAAAGGWQRPPPTAAFPPRVVRDEPDEAARQAGKRSDGGTVHVVFNSPMSRYALPVPNLLQQTGKSLCEFLDAQMGLYEIHGFAILDLYEDPVEYRNGLENLLKFQARKKLSK